MQWSQLRRLVVIVVLGVGYGHQRVFAGHAYRVRFPAAPSLIFVIRSLLAPFYGPPVAWCLGSIPISSMYGANRGGSRQGYLRVRFPYGPYIVVYSKE